MALHVQTTIRMQSLAQYGTVGFCPGGPVQTTEAALHLQMVDVTDVFGEI
jgi:hypothetical protein